MTINSIIKKLSQLQSTDRLYNLYSDTDGEKGVIRQQNLRRYLERMRQIKTDTLLLAEAPGYRGCRYTGIPVTSERIMMTASSRWDLFGDGYQMTSGAPEGMSEMTATILWEAIEDFLPHPPIIWNTAPLHPHKEGHPESNLTPSTEELHAGIPFIAEIVALYKPTRILTMGRKAQIIAEEMNLTAIPLRHPSHGGKTEFIEGLLDAYQID